MMLEHFPFKINVIELKTGCGHLNFHANRMDGAGRLPEWSICTSAEDAMEMAIYAFLHKEEPEN